MSITPIGDLMIAIKADIDDYQKSMATASDITAGFKNTLASLGATIRNTGAVLTAMGGIAAGATAAIVASTSRINKAFREVSTLMDINSDAMSRFGDQVTRLTSQFSVQGGRVQTLQSLYQTLSAGFTGTAESVTVLENALRLSKIGFVEADAAVENLTKTLNAYGMSADEAQKASDVLFSVVQFGVVKFNQLNKSLVPILGVANSAGVELEQVAAAFAQLTKSGQPARRAAFALRSTITKMQKPSAALSRVLRKLAVEGNLELSKRVQENVDKLRNQKSTLNDLQADLQNQQTELASTRQKYNELGNELSGLEGQFDDLSDSMRDNRIKIKEIRLAAQKEGRDLTESEKDRIDELQLKNEEYRLEQMKMEREMESVREKREKTNETMQKQQDKVDETRQKITEQESAISESQATIEKFAGSISTSIIEQEGFVGALNMMINRGEEMGVPLQSMFNNVRAYSAIIKLAGDNTENYQETLSNLKDNAGVTQRQMERFDDSMGSNFRRTIQNLKQTFHALGQELIDVLLPYVKDANSVISDFKDYFKGLDDSVKQAVARFGILSSVFALIVGPLLFISGMFLTIAGTLGTALIPIIGVAAVATYGLMSAFSDVAKGGEEADSRLDDFKETIKSVIDFVRNLKDVFVEELLPGFKDLGGGMMAVIKEIVSAFSDMGNAAEDGGLSLRDIASIIGDMMSIVGNFMKENDKLIASLLMLGAGAKAATTLYTAFKSLQGIMASFKAAPMVATAVSRVQKALYLLGKVLGGGIASQVKTLSANFARVLSTSGSLKAALLTVGKQALPAVLSAAARLTVVTTLISAAFYALKNDTAGIRTAIVNTFTRIATIVTTAFGDVMGFINNKIIPEFQKFQEFMGKHQSETGAIMDGLKAVFMGTFKAIAIAIAVVGRVITGIISGFLDVIVGLWDAWGGAIIATLGAIWTTIINSIMMAVDQITSIFKIITLLFRGEYIKAFKEGVALTKRQLTRLEAIFGSIINAIANIITGAIQVIVSFFTLGFLSTGDVQKGINEILSFFASFWPSSDAKRGPLSDITSWGPGLVNTFLNGIKKGFSAMAGKVKKWIKTYITTVFKVGSTIAGFATKAIKAYWKAIKTALKTLLNLASKLYTHVGSPFEDLVDNATNWGENLIDDFISGIKNKLGDVKNAANKIGKAVKDRIGIFSDAKTGPLSNVTQWGPNLGETFSKGLKGQVKSVKEAAKKTGSGAVEGYRKGIKDSEGKLKKSAKEMGNVLNNNTPNKLQGPQAIEAPAKGLPGSKAQKKVQDITFQNGALQILPGAFQGVSEEELPQKVREEIGNELEVVIDRIEGKGHSPSKKQ